MIIESSILILYVFSLIVESTVVACCCQLLVGVLVARIQVYCRLAQLWLLHSCT